MEPDSSPVKIPHPEFHFGVDFPVSTTVTSLRDLGTFVPFSEEMQMADAALKIELSTPGFFSIPLKKVDIETVPGTGRTYFIYQDRIVAVARRSGGHKAIQKDHHHVEQV